MLVDAVLQGAQGPRPSTSQHVTAHCMSHHGMRGYDEHACTCSRRECELPSPQGNQLPWLCMNISAVR